MGGVTWVTMLGERGELFSVRGRDDEAVAALCSGTVSAGWVSWNTPIVALGLRVMAREGGWVVVDGGDGIVVVVVVVVAGMMTGVSVTGR